MYKTTLYYCENILYLFQDKSGALNRSVNFTVAIKIYIFYEELNFEEVLHTP